MCVSDSLLSQSFCRVIGRSHDDNLGKVLQILNSDDFKKPLTLAPVANNRLVEGYIILVLKQDDDDELDFDPATLTVTGNGLLLNGAPIPNTHMVCGVTFDAVRGRDTTSSWSKKFDQPSSKADEVLFAEPNKISEI